VDFVGHRSSLIIDGNGQQLWLSEREYIGTNANQSQFHGNNFIKTNLTIFI